MRMLPTILALLFLSGSAAAGPLPVTGTLEVELAPFGGPLSVSVTGSAIATVNGSGGGLHLSALTVPSTPFAGTTSVPVTDPVAAPIGGLQLTVHNGPGQLVGSGGAGFGGPLPLEGMVKLCLGFATCGFPPAANLSVPLAVGASTTITRVGLVNLTAVGAPWTTGTVTAGGTAVAGFVHGPASLTSTTLAASGAVSLVTPIFISTNLGPMPTIPGFARLTLHFAPVPEPTVLLLLGSALSLVVWGSRHRSR